MLTLQDIIHLPHRWEALASTGLYEAYFYIPICQSQLRNCLSLHFRKRDCECVEVTLRLMAASQAFFNIHSCALPQLSGETAARYSLNLQRMSSWTNLLWWVWALQTYNKGHCSWECAERMGWGAGLFIRKVTTTISQGNVCCRSWSTVVHMGEHGENCWWELPDSSILWCNSRDNRKECFCQKFLLLAGDRTVFIAEKEENLSTITQNLRPGKIPLHSTVISARGFPLWQDLTSKPILCSGLKWNGW